LKLALAIDVNAAGAVVIADQLYLTTGKVDRLR
jgi:hypothetical protein